MQIRQGALTPAPGREPADRSREFALILVLFVAFRVMALLAFRPGGQVLDYSDFFVSDADLSYDEKAFDKRIRKPAEAPELLAKVRDLLADAASFDVETLEPLLRRFVEAEGIKIGQIYASVPPGGLRSRRRLQNGFGTRRPRSRAPRTMRPFLP